jgi:hypothetical protein
MVLRRPILAERKRFASVFVAVWAGALVACQDVGPPPPQPRILFHWMMTYGEAYAPDSLTRSYCFLNMRLPADSLPTTPWTSTQTARARRDVVVINREAFSREDSLPQLRITALFGASDSVEIVLDGPYVDTLSGRRLRDTNGFAYYEGAWSCPVRFPRATDSTLVAHGYDAQLPIVGLWRIVPVRPID